MICRKEEEELYINIIGKALTTWMLCFRVFEFRVPRSTGCVRRVESDRAQSKDSHVCRRATNKRVRRQGMASLPESFLPAKQVRCNNHKAVISLYVCGWIGGCMHVCGERS